MIGAYIGYHHFPVFSKNLVTKHGAIFCIVICSSLAFIYTKIDRNAFNYVEKTLYLLSLIIFCFAMWNAFDLFKNESYFAFQKESFPIYVLHIDVAAVITKLLYFILPKSDYFAIVNYVCTILITVVGITAFALLLDKKFHRIKKVLFGR